MVALKELELSGKRVLIRVDFNVPLDDHGNITDTTRIERSLPTIRYVLEKGGRPILMSHLGRPKGERKEALSLRPCVGVLEEALKVPVHLAPDCVGPEVEKMTHELNGGEVLLLENLRFHQEEEHPTAAFVEGLARLGDCYINDAFGTAHRAHSSTTVIASHFPGQAAAGFLLEKEIAFLGEALLKPKRPFMAIIGGAKVSSKLGILKALRKKADRIFVGGGMAYTFLKGQGVEVGLSLVEEGLVGQTRDILAGSGAEIILPSDVVCAKEISEGAATQVIELKGGIPAGLEGLDVGPVTIAAWDRELEEAQTIFWNGPLGVFEVTPFAGGTRAMAGILAESKATTIVGGGDSIAALNQMGLASRIDHISTGGGAALEYIEYGTLPGIQALRSASGETPAPKAQ